MTPRDAEAFLLALPRFADQGTAAYRPGLERMEALLEAMGRPHERFQSVHIAGTNGKGSTASFLAAILTAAGYRTGLHTSPHLFSLNERLRIDGRPASWTWLAEAVACYRNAFERIGPSFFEATVALSFLYFAEQDVDWAVVEVGLGGRLDATNVLRPDLAVITAIGLDHTDLLGTTVDAIASEKAGIIKPGTPILTSAAQPEAIRVIRQAADAQTSAFHSLREEVEVLSRLPSLERSILSVRTPLRRYDDLVIGLAGAHQQTNALLALRAAEIVLPDALSEADVRRGLRDVRDLAGLRGRLDVLSSEPLVILDVAHNPDGLAAALAFIRTRMAPEGTLHVLLGVMRDKAVPEMARLLAQASAVVTPVPLASNRAMPAHELGTVLAQQGVRVMDSLRVEEHLALFFQHTRLTDALLVTGSHLVAAQLPPPYVPL